MAIKLINVAALDQMQGSRKTKLWFFWPYLTYIFSLQDLATPCFLSNFTFLLQIHGHLVIQISDISEISQSSFLLPSNYSSLEKTIIYVFIRSLFENTILWILLQTYKEVLFVGKPWQRVFMNMMIFCAFQENFDEWSHLTIGIEKKQAFMLKIIIWSVLTLIKNLLTQLLWSLVETKIFF